MCCNLHERYADADVTSKEADETTSQWLSTSADWTTSTQTTTTITTTTPGSADDNDKSMNARFIIIPCALAAIPLLVVIICVIRAITRHLCTAQPPPTTASAGDVQFPDDSLEMNRPAAGFENSLYKPKYR